MERARVRPLPFNKVVALAVAILVAMLTPAGFYALNFRYLAATVEVDTRLAAHLVDHLTTLGLANAHEQFERIGDLLQLAHHDRSGIHHVHRLFDRQGSLIAEHPPGAAPAPPVLDRSLRIENAGAAFGRIETVVSLQPLILRTFLVTVLALAAAGGVVVGLRAVQLRDLRRALERLSHMASHDELTGLPNRSLFADRLSQTLAQAGRRREETAVLCIDLNDFKDVNDALGHVSGDSLLKQVASRLADCVRKSETLARLVGDEFAVIQCGSKQPVGAAALAQRIMDALNQPFTVGNKTVFVTASIGIAISGRGPDASAERLLRNADIALHQAKKEGRAAYRFFEEAMNVRFQARKNLEQDLRQAMSQGQFVLHYQPQIDLATGWAIGAEALIRWQHPHRGLISPAEFIPLAEDTGLIVPLGEWVLQAACAEAAAWRHLSLAVNLSPAQFRQPQLSEMVARVVTETTIEPHRLELEITENLLLHDTKATLATLRLLKEIGVRIAMDDFGTGYSSLGYLHRFPFDKIKIDRTFIRDLGHSAEATAIVRAIIGLGHSLGMRAVAEGVETKEQVVLLKKEGCHEVQGYYFARPMPAAELSRFLDRQAARAEKPVASQHGGGVPARTPKISLAAAAARISPRKPS